MRNNSLETTFPAPHHAPPIDHSPTIVVGFQPSLTVGNLGAAEAAQSQFRALDVFVVQANTNTLLSHFCSLAASLWLLTRLPKLAILAKGA